MKTARNLRLLTSAATGWRIFRTRSELEPSALALKIIDHNRACFSGLRELGQTAISKAAGEYKPGTPEDGLPPDSVEDEQSRLVEALWPELPSVIFFVRREDAGSCKKEWYGNKC